MGTLEKAISVLEKQAEDLDKAEFKPIGKYLLQRLQEPDCPLIPHLLKEGKSLKSCINYMQKQAMLQVTENGAKRHEGGSAVIGADGDTLLKWAVDYYESDQTEVKFNMAELMPRAKTATPAKVEKKAKEAPPNLFDLFTNDGCAVTDNKTEGASEEDSEPDDELDMPELDDSGDDDDFIAGIRKLAQKGEEAEAEIEIKEAAQSEAKEASDLPEAKLFNVVNLFSEGLTAASATPDGQQKITLSGYTA